jgi:hypothetical protein
VLETEANSAAASELDEQVTVAVQNKINSLINTAIEKQQRKITAQILDTIKTQQSTYSKQATTSFSEARDKLNIIQQEENEQLSQLIGQTIQTELVNILQDCKTRVSRQTRRKRQIDQILTATLSQIHSTIGQLLGQSNKPIVTQLNQEITNIFQEFRTQLTSQTNRTKQISTIFKTSQTNLEKLSQEILPRIFEQRFNDQTTTLITPVQECKTQLEQIQQSFIAKVQQDLQSLTPQDEDTTDTSKLPTPISTVLQNTTQKVLNQTRMSLQKKRRELESQASPVFITALENTLSKQLLPKLKAFQKDDAPPLKPILDKTRTQLSNTWEKFDAGSKALLDKYWLPLTHIIDDYSTTTVSNLSALNTAIATSLDQASVNTSTTMTMFGDDVANLLTATTQAFNREKAGLKEQITQGIAKMQEDSLSQIQETKTLLEKLNQEVLVQKSSLTQKMKTMAKDIEATTSHLGAVHETADAFVASIETELAQQEGRVEKLRKDVQELILEQNAKIIDGIGKIETKLEDFQENQLQKAQTIVEEIGQTCTTKIDDQRKAIGDHLQTFASALSNEMEHYINNLQQEIVQLQTIAAKLIDRFQTTRTALDTEFKTQIQTHQVNMISTLEEQYTSINNEISSTLDILIEQVTSLQSQLLTHLSQWKEKGKETLELKQTQITTTLDDTLAQTTSKSIELSQNQQNQVAEKTAQLVAKLQEYLSSIDEITKTTLDSLVQSLTTHHSTLHTEVDQLFSSTSASVEEDAQKFYTNMTHEIDQTLQNYAQTLDLTKTRLTRATDDSIRRTTTSLQTFKDTASTEIQQRSSAIEAGLKQNISSVEEGLVTQTKQTGSRVSRALSKERGNLKTEYQTLSKEITSNLKTAETNSINTLQLFAQKTEPLLAQLREQASGTEQILIGLWETLSGVQPTDADHTWRIVSCQGIQHHLLDMFRRVQGTITLVYPSFDEVPFEEISKVQPQNRVHIITTFDGEKQQTAAQKLLQQGNIRIWDNPNMEFYGGSRDGEEVLIAPTHGNQGEVVAVVSDQASYIALFNQTLGPRWISASKELRIRS